MGDSPRIPRGLFGGERNTRLVRNLPVLFDIRGGGEKKKESQKREEKKAAQLV